MALFGSSNQPSPQAGARETKQSINLDSALIRSIALDRGYIPPLFFTSVEKPAASRERFATFQRQWNTFQSNSSKLFQDPEWADDKKKIDLHVGKAEAMIASGTGLKDAYEELEHIRLILMEARRHNHFEYDIDHLTAFHEPMEEIVLMAKQTLPDQWTAETTARISSSLPKAES